MLFYPNSPQWRPQSPVVIPMVERWPQKSSTPSNRVPAALSVQVHLGQVGQMSHPSGVIWSAKPMYSPPSQLPRPTFPLCPTPIRVRTPSSPSVKISSSAWAPSPVSSWTSKPTSNASSPAMPSPLTAAIPPNVLSLEDGALGDSSPSLLRPFLCHHCSKSFRQRAHLKAHMRIHSGERPFSCSTCSKSFSEKSTLTRHRRVHSGERPYSCPFEGCMKAFANREPLRRHVRVHTGERPYTCPLCGKSFAQSTHRLVHMRSHSGERPFKCPICSRAFAHKSHVKRHCSAVHNRGQAMEVIVPTDDAMGLNAGNPCPDVCAKLQPEVIEATTSTTNLGRSCHGPPVHFSDESSNIDQSSSSVPLLLLNSSRLCHSR